MPLPDEEKDTAVAPTKEELEQAAHERRVNEDPADVQLPDKAAKEPEKEPEKEAPAAEGEGEAKEGLTEEFDAEILGIAADFGMTEATARSYSTVADLERALHALASREESAPKTEEREWTDEIRKLEAQKEKAKLEPIHLQGGEDLDEALVKQVNEALDGISGRYDDKTAALEKTIAELTSTMQANQAAQFVRCFDDMLERHGEPYRHELGEGSTLELTGKHRKNRDRVVDEMGVIVAACQLRKRAIPSDAQLVQRALKEVFGDKGKDNGEVKKRQGQFLRRSSSRASASPSTKVRARIELREKLAALRGGEDES
jgi:hypothetical protein